MGSSEERALAIVSNDLPDAAEQMVILLLKPSSSWTWRMATEASFDADATNVLFSRTNALTAVTWL